VNKLEKPERVPEFGHFSYSGSWARGTCERVSPWPVSFGHCAQYPLPSIHIPHSRLTCRRQTTLDSSSITTSPMSHTPSMATAPSHFQSVFKAALKTYEKRTKKDLTAHPLASQLQSCDSTTAILSLLQDQVREFDQAHSGDESLTKWLNPTVNVLCAFSVALGEGIGLVSH